MERLRSRSGVLTLGVVGSALTLVTMSLTWARLGGGAPLRSDAVLTGREAAPVAFALALAALAGLGALLLVGRGGRRVIGGVLVLIGAGIVASAVDAGQQLESLVQAGLTGPILVVTDSARPIVEQAEVWAWAAAVGGILVLVAGIAAVLGGRGWSEPSSRYAAAGPRGSDPWSALDQGVDPTLGD